MSLDVMVRRRREGKTYQTIEWLYDDPTRVLVCDYEQRAQRLLKDYPVLEGHIFSLATWRHGQGRGHNIEVALDDAESVLYDAIGPNLTRITLTGKSI